MSEVEEERRKFVHVKLIVKVRSAAFHFYPLSSPVTGATMECLVQSARHQKSSHPLRERGSIVCITVVNAMLVTIRISPASLVARLRRNQAGNSAVHCG